MASLLLLINKKRTILKLSPYVNLIILILRCFYIYYFVSSGNKTTFRFPVIFFFIFRNKLHFLIEQWIILIKERDFQRTWSNRHRYDWCLLDCYNSMTYQRHFWNKAQYLQDHYSPESRPFKYWTINTATVPGVSFRKGCCQMEEVKLQILPTFPDRPYWRNFFFFGLKVIGQIIFNHEIISIRNALTA